MVSLLIVAISLVSSNETKKEEQHLLTRQARAANGGKGKCFFYTFKCLSYTNLRDCKQILTFIKFKLIYRNKLPL